jgi:sulfite reductase (NADPH) flavoprotein alpha-component
VEIAVRRQPGGWCSGQLVALESGESIRAFARATPARHVQDALRAEGAELARLIRDCARVWSASGRDLAAAASEALAGILTSAGLDPAALKAEARCVEDVF